MFTFFFFFLFPFHFLFFPFSTDRLPFTSPPSRHEQ
ncbi:hypothetical protein GLYMA_10G111250v4 [Glycine max]|nr:hypothetical protein GLYMA_10G111250v4 [Glycine max]